MSSNGLWRVTSEVLGEPRAGVECHGYYRVAPNARTAIHERLAREAELFGFDGVPGTETDYVDANRFWIRCEDLGLIFWAEFCEPED